MRFNAINLNLTIINTTAAHLLIASHLPELIKSLPSRYLRRKITNHSSYHWPKQNQLQSFQLSTQAVSDQGILQDPLSQHFKSRWFLIRQELAGPTSTWPTAPGSLAEMRRVREHKVGSHLAGRQRDHTWGGNPPHPPYRSARPGHTGRESKDRAIVAREGGHAWYRVSAPQHRSRLRPRWVTGTREPEAPTWNEAGGPGPQGDLPSPGFATQAGTEALKQGIQEVSMAPHGRTLPTTPTGTRAATHCPDRGNHEASSSAAAAAAPYPLAQPDRLRARMRTPGARDPAPSPTLLGKSWSAATPLPSPLPPVGRVRPLFFSRE